MMQDEGSPRRIGGEKELNRQDAKEEDRGWTSWVWEFWLVGLGVFCVWSFCLFVCFLGLELRVRERDGKGLFSAKSTLRAAEWEDKISKIFSLN